MPSFFIETLPQKTEPLRGNFSQLLVSFIKPHLPVSLSTIARWLKETMTAAGIDTTVFKAHSVRGASSSTAANKGVTTDEILEAADWSTESSFQRFY